MVNPILSNGAFAHNLQPSGSVQEYLERYDDLFEHLNKLKALTAMMLMGGLENSTVAQQLYWYIVLLDDETELMEAALKEMDRLQKFLIHGGCRQSVPTLPESGLPHN